MFRHQGKSRTIQHNLQIATVLSFVAGLVNVTGFLAIQRLTTNVTGHFAFFIDDVARLQFWQGLVYFLYLLSFLLGSFCSGALIERVSRRRRLNIFVLPTLLESGVLIGVALLTQWSLLQSADVIACLLLFAMGVQNAFVTKISNAVVRTTHLTGLFTDLGIELSQLLYPLPPPQRHKLRATIKLRLYIICFFFLGGIAGGYLYSGIGYGALLIGALILLAGLAFDTLKFRMIRIRRKYRTGNRLLRNTGTVA